METHMKHTQPFTPIYSHNMDKNLESASCSKYITPEGFTIEKYEHYNGQEDSEIPPDESKKKPFPKRIRKSKLPLHLRGLMGEANLRYARREFDIAKKMCFEIIRQSPDAYEPYETLAHMYENTNFKKYKGFLTLACHLEPYNSDLWCRLAEVEMQESHLTDAIQCYTKAIQAEPSNEALHLKRMELVMQEGDIKALLKCKLLMASHIPISEHEKIMHICKDLAEKYFREGKNSLAIKALNVPIKRIPDKVTPDIINMMLELLLLCERYSECLDIFTMFCGFTFDITVENDSFTVNTYSMPENLHLDLKVKFMICLIRLDRYDLVSTFMDQMLCQENIEEVGALFLDIVEALMAAGYYPEALKFTIPLIKSQNYSLAAVWLKHAECLKMSEMYDQAIDAYYTVMTLAPNHVEVLYPLAMLLLKLDKKEEALEVLSQDLSTNKLDVAVLIEHMKLLKQIKDYKNYWICCELLLSRHCVVFKNYEEIKCALNLSTLREKIAKIKSIRKFRGQDDETVESSLESLQEPSVQEEFQLYIKILQLALQEEDFKQYQKLAFMGLISKRFVQYFSEIYLIAGHSCLFSRDFYHGRYNMREIFLRYPNNSIAWNYFSLNMQLKDEFKYFRFFEKFNLKKMINPSTRAYVHANWLLSHGNIVECMSFFIEQYKLTHSPYSSFMIGMCFLQIYCQSKRNKNWRYIKSLPETATAFFMNYAKLRCKEAQQEVFYNLGRLYHQMSVMHLAEHFYKQALNVRTDLIDENLEVLSLKQEAAFNLSLIYKNSGNFVAARNVLLENIII